MIHILITATIRIIIIGVPIFVLIGFVIEISYPNSSPFLIHTYTHTHTHTFTHMHTHIHIHIHTYVHTHPFTHTRTFTHTHTCTHTHTDVIERPICLRDVKNKVEAGEYSKYMQHTKFAQDMRLIWRNCKLYNLYRSQIWYVHVFCGAIKFKAVISIFSHVFFFTSGVVCFISYCFFFLIISI